jgi:hypothetical protein
MRLDLTEEEAGVLSDILREYLPGLQREVARTDKKELRHDLFVRQEICERLSRRIEMLAHEQLPNT